MSYPISNALQFEIQDNLMSGLRNLGNKSWISHPLAIPAVVADGVLESVRLSVRSIENVVNAIFQILGAVVSRKDCSLKMAIGHVEAIGHNAASLAALPVKLLYNVITIAWNPAQNARSVAKFYNK